MLEEQETSPERGSKREDRDVLGGKGKLLPCRLLLLLSAPFLLLLRALELSLARPSSLNLSSTLCFSLSPGLNKLPSQAFNYATTMIRKCYRVNLLYLLCHNRSYTIYGTCHTKSELIPCIVSSFNESIMSDTTVGQWACSTCTGAL